MATTKKIARVQLFQYCKVIECLCVCLSTEEGGGGAEGQGGGVNVEFFAIDGEIDLTS